MKSIRQFIDIESFSGIILLVAALLALIISNSHWSPIYDKIFHGKFQLSFNLYLDKKQFTFVITDWINHGLMTIFFFLVGLEIKREMVQGELNSLKKTMLPAIAALGGMIVPAVIYVLLNRNNSIALRGWAIPCATDIAFALGVLRLLHGRIVPALKIFLTALAIFDDIGAIVIIALFYNTHISWFFISLALICLLFLILLNHFSVKKLLPYLLLGVILWFFVLQSGIDPVIAGVILAPTIPLTGSPNSPSPLLLLEEKLHPWVGFFILPLFAFANAGVSFSGASAHIFNLITWGIILGLFLGKQWGVFAATWLTVKLRLASMPANSSWKEIYGVAIICGIGFTMSLFIGTLAFPNVNGFLPSVRIGVIFGSLLSGIVGYIVLRWRGRLKNI